MSLTSSKRIEAITKFSEPMYDLIISAAAAEITTALQYQRKVITCGNGGSMADAMHLAAELTGHYVKDRKGMPAVVLSDPVALTAIANDYGFERVFSRQIEAIGESGDVLVVFSTSGKSPNILSAIDYAQDMKIKVIMLTGEHGPSEFLKSDILINVPSTVTAIIQELHTIAIHRIMDKIEAI